MVKRLTMKVTEAATALGVGRGTAYDMARDGRLPVIRVGTRLLVPIEGLERMVRKAYTDSSGPSPEGPN